MDALSRKSVNKLSYKNQQNRFSNKKTFIENQAIKALAEISNQQTRYRDHDWMNPTVNLKQTYHKFQKSLQIQRNRPILSSKFKLPNINQQKLSKLKTQPNCSSYHQQIDNQPNINSMNSVCGFISYKKYKHPKRYGSTHSYKNKIKNIHVVSTQQNIQTEQQMMKDEERSQQIKQWLKQKRNQCKSLRKLLDKYSMGTHNQHGFLQKHANQQQKSSLINIKALFCQRSTKINNLNRVL